MNVSSKKNQDPPSMIELLEKFITNLNKHLMVL